MYISFLLLFFAYVHVIRILSEHMHIMRTLSAVVLDIFLPNRQCRCHPYVISSTLYIFYYVQLSFRTLSTQINIVHVICMLFAHVHIICFSSLTLLVYPICPLSMYLHVVHTCTRHLLVISNTPHIPYYPQLSFRTYCLNTRTLSISCVYCLQMHMLCTSHFYCCSLHMYMSSAYYLSICILCAHYLQWSLIYSFQTDNADVIHMSSLVLFIYSIMYNLVSAHCLHR